MSLPDRTVPMPQQGSFRAFLLFWIALWTCCFAPLASADTPYLHRVMSTKELWKLYRFAWNQKNYRAHYDRYYKYRLFRTSGTVIGQHYNCRERDVLYLDLREEPTGYSVILVIPFSYSASLFRIAQELKPGTEIEFIGSLLDSMRSNHLRLAFQPRSISLVTPHYERPFRNEFSSSQ